MTRSTCLFFLCSCLALTTASCVAETNFESTSFDPVQPESTAAESSPAENAAINSENKNVFQVKFETSKGDFVVEVHPDWAPNGAARFKELVENKVFDDARFFRVIEGFMVQFGIAADPKVSAEWRNKQIKDDRVSQSNTRGMVTFATAGPNTRTSQIFINFGNNAFLDNQGFAPFAKIVEGMDVVDSLYNGYGEGAPNGNGPSQGRIQSEGNAYLTKDFPKLDYIKKATLVIADE